MCPSNEHFGLIITNESIKFILLIVIRTTLLNLFNHRIWVLVMIGDYGLLTLGWGLGLWRCQITSIIYQDWYQ